MQNAAMNIKAMIISNFKISVDVIWQKKTIFWENAHTKLSSHLLKCALFFIFLTSVFAFYPVLIYGVRVAYYSPHA